MSLKNFNFALKFAFKIKRFSHKFAFLNEKFRIKRKFTNNFSTAKNSEWAIGLCIFATTLLVKSN